MSERPRVGVVSLCECGCGRPAGVYAKTNRARGETAGQPKRRLPGHGAKGRVDTAALAAAVLAYRDGASLRSVMRSFHLAFETLTQELGRLGLSTNRGTGGRRTSGINVVRPGDRFGRLVALGEANRSTALVECRCDCGTVRSLTLASLFAKAPTRSCGCARLETITKHGHTGDQWANRSSGTYNSWQGMFDRCSRPRSRAWSAYGGRGIKICVRWDPKQGGSFENFLADMGERPEWARGGIDRVDVDGDYEPSNCRWATSKEQAENRRKVLGSRYLVLNDKGWLAQALLAKSVSQLSIELGCDRTTVYDAIHRLGLSLPGKRQ